MGSLILCGDSFDGFCRVVFDGANAEGRLEDYRQKTKLVDVDDDEAGLLTLLVDAGKVVLPDERRDALRGSKGGRGERGEGHGIQLLGASVLRDDKSTLVDHEGGRGIAFNQQLLECVVDFVDVFFDELGKRRHSLDQVGRR